MDEGSKTPDERVAVLEATLERMKSAIREATAHFCMCGGHPADHPAACEACQIYGYVEREANG